MEIAEDNLRTLARVLCSPVRNRLNAQQMLPLRRIAQTASQVQQRKQACDSPHRHTDMSAGTETPKSAHQRQ